MGRNLTRVYELQGAVHNAVRVGESCIAMLTRRFRDDETGAAAIEYALVASMIFLAIVAPVAALSPRVRALYESVLAVFP